MRDLDATPGGVIVVLETGSARAAIDGDVSVLLLGADRKARPSED